ncbi:MAG: hypothetical protein GY696_37165 [Gammaproteobacteria bacterium]|nr:hypothetical protein [Gammaproteobacteria bacterium]
MAGEDNLDPEWLPPVQPPVPLVQPVQLQQVPPVQLAQPPLHVVDHPGLLFSYEGLTDSENYGPGGYG